MDYEDTAIIPRTVDAGSSNRKLRTYNPFGCKIFAGEKPPDSKYLCGFNDRTFRAEVNYQLMSTPKFDIISNSA
jgi:hypothetical protein